MGRRLLGQPIEEDSPAEDIAAKTEPEFTWERPTDKPPFVNDTELELP
jgi:hypothetical protein